MKPLFYLFFAAVGIVPGYEIYRANEPKLNAEFKAGLASFERSFPNTADATREKAHQVFIDEEMGRLRTYYAQYPSASGTAGTEWQIQEDRRVAEAHLTAEERRFLEERRLGEMRRLTEERRLAEERRLGDERRLAEEHHPLDTHRPLDYRNPLEGGHPLGNHNPLETHNPVDDHNPLDAHRPADYHNPLEGDHNYGNNRVVGDHTGVPAGSTSSPLAQAARTTGSPIHPLPGTVPTVHVAPPHPPIIPPTTSTVTVPH